DGDLRVYVYDVTNSRLIEVIDRDVKANAQGSYIGSFQTSDSTSYRLILHVADSDSGAWDVKLDDVTVAPQVLTTARGRICGDELDCENSFSAVVATDGSVSDLNVAGWVTSCSKSGTSNNSTACAFGTGVFSEKPNCTASANDAGIFVSYQRSSSSAS